MPKRVSNAILLLWLAIALSALPYVSNLLNASSIGDILRQILAFGYSNGLLAFAIILLPSRNNLARLAILAVTAANLLFLLLQLSGMRPAWGVIAVASVGSAAYASYLLIQSDDWFGTLRDIALKGDAEQ